MCLPMPPSWFSPDCDYYNSFVNSVFCILTPTNLLFFLNSKPLSYTFFPYKKGQLKMKCENQDGSVGRHTVPPGTTRTDRKSKGKEVRHQGNKK